MPNYFDIKVFVISCLLIFLVILLQFNYIYILFIIIVIHD